MLTGEAGDRGAGVFDRLRTLDGVRLWTAVFLPLSLVYVMTATYTLRQSVDTANTAVQSYQIADTGSPAIDDLEEPGTLGMQHRPGRDGTVTDRHPGPVLVGVVAYLVASPLLPDAGSVTTFVDVPLWPAAVGSALLAAAAVATVGVALTRMAGITRDTALGATAVLALGTATWSVSANALWTHTVTQLGIAVAIGGFVAQRSTGPGLGLGLAVLARPHAALIAAGGGLGQAWQQRRVGPALVVGVLSAAGLGVAILYGMWVFGGDASVTVGRGDVGERLRFEAARTTPFGAVGNLALMVVHPTRGLLPTTPVLIPLVLGLPAAWRRAPWWARGLAVGGAAQFLVQGMVNHYSGGDAFFGSRVTLEFLMATLPLWVLAYGASEGRPRMRMWTHVTALASVIVHAAGATVLSLGVVP